jgi:hypothetical protein
MSKTFVYDRFDISGDGVASRDCEGEFVHAQAAINREAVLQAEIRTLQVQLKEAKAPQWISVDERLPADETPVLIMLRGEITIGELRWEHPSHEETYQAFRYWDNPSDDGQDWQWHDVTHWMALSAAPKEPA